MPATSRPPPPFSTPSCSAMPSAPRACAQIFSDHALIARYVEVEVALARAEARCGVIPAEAAEAIAARIDARRASTSTTLRDETDIVGYPILPLVHQLVELCGEAGRYVHWGATTQDIMDTAVVLQVRAALDDRRGRHRASCAASSPISPSKHRDTPMAGRTHLQQALPVTFGYKAAIWLAMFDRHAERLAQLRRACWSASSPARPARWPRSATRASRCRRRCAEELGLGVPATTWHVARDGFAEAVNLLGAGHRLARQDRARRHDHGVDRVRRGVRALRQGPRRVRSTMPQKRNPISSELMLAAVEGGAPARRPDARRDDPGFRARHRPVACRMDRDPRELHAHGGRAASGQVRARRPDRRREHAWRTTSASAEGLIVAEAVMMGLAPHIGRQQAHDVVYDACRTVNEKGGTLAEALAALPEVTERFDRADDRPPDRPCATTSASRRRWSTRCSARRSATPEKHIQGRFAAPAL